MWGLVCNDFKVANIKFLEGVIMDYCEIKKKKDSKPLPSHRNVIKCTKWELNI